MENEAVVVVLSQRLDESGVHRNALVESHIAYGLDHIDSVLDVLRRQERVNVANEELEVHYSVAIGHDDGQPMFGRAIQRLEFTAGLKAQRPQLIVDFVKAYCVVFYFKLVNLKKNKCFDDLSILNS